MGLSHVAFVEAIRSHLVSGVIMKLLLAITDCAVRCCGMAPCLLLTLSWQGVGGVVQEPVLPHGSALQCPQPWSPGTLEAETVFNE